MLIGAYEYWALQLTGGAHETQVSGNTHAPLSCYLRLRVEKNETMCAERTNLEILYKSVIMCQSSPHFLGLLQVPFCPRFEISADPTIFARLFGEMRCEVTAFTGLSAFLSSCHPVWTVRLVTILYLLVQSSTRVVHTRSSSNEIHSRWFCS